MKVLYTGYYKEKSDWGRQTVNQILALESAGVDVVCRSIELGGGTETPEELKHLEDKDDQYSTHCVQHVFPEHMVGTGKFTKNIGFFTNNFVRMDHSSWVEKLSLMDEIWVPSQLVLDHHLLPNKLTARTKHIPLAVDLNVFNQKYNNISIPEANGKFKVYAMASSNDLNGLAWLVSTFHTEFDESDSAVLIIHIKVDTQDGQKELKVVEDLSRAVKTTLSLRKDPGDYQKDIIIASSLTERNKYELHNYCDCYVSVNTETTFPLSDIQAAGFGNSPIASDLCSIREYIGVKNEVRSVYQVKQTKERGIFADQTNGKDYYIRPDEMLLKTKMRQSYNEWKSNPMRYKLKAKVAALELLSEFSFESVGQKMKETLNV